jgi:GTP-binding protein
LIEGAHEGHGLGIDFLKHIERTALILHMIDISQPEPLSQYEKIRKELELFSKDLAQKPEIVVATKMDIPEAQESLKSFKKDVDKPVFAISSATGAGLKELLYEIKNLCSKNSE